MRGGSPAKSTLPETNVGIRSFSFGLAYFQERTILVSGGCSKKNIRNVYEEKKLVRWAQEPILTRNLITPSIGVT